MTTKYIEIDRAIETALLLLEEGEDEQTLAYNAALVAFIKNMENVPAADIEPQFLQQGRLEGKVMDDLISRQAVLDMAHAYGNGYEPEGFCVEVEDIQSLPPAQPEPLTDKEQRIFLAAMGREEKVCKQVDDECRDCREPYEDSLVRTCHEIVRKVKGALWT